MKTEVTQVKQDILDTIDAIIKYELSQKDNCSNRQPIIDVFNSTKGDKYNKSGIITRLVVIDSIYATNAGYSYYSFEEMADKILAIGNENDAVKCFQALSSTQGSDKLKASKKKDFTTNTLFDEPYGIQKNLSDGAKQISLMSKYAFYQLLEIQDDGIGFSIYDRLANDAYPIVCDMLKIDKESQQDPYKTIASHIAAFDELRKSIFGKSTKRYKDYQQFDLLDAYLWRMGKFTGGNIASLSREDYTKFITNLGLAAEKKDNKWETATAYKQRLAQKSDFSSIKKTKQKVTKNETITTSEVDINPAILELLKTKASRKIFKSLKAEKYMTILHQHWLNYFNK